jgi:putative membrane protein
MQHFWLFLKGIAMGAADVVPGVSGGTIAFVTGIYTELLDSIKNINLQALKTLFKDGPRAFWQSINGTFLLVLGSGILLALLSLARGIHYLLMNYPVWLWAFFFGLILASCWYIGKEIGRWGLAQLVLLALGAVIAGFISTASPTSVTPTPLIILLAGSIAICAMILPGISGSFILLLMGLYEPVLGAVRQLDIQLLGTFAVGAAIGLMAFSRLLSWLLHHYKDAMFALLTGFMAGSLLKVWPWKETLSTRLNSHGAEVPFIQSNILPDSGLSLLLALGLMLAGALLVLGLERFASRTAQ